MPIDIPFLDCSYRSSFMWQGFLKPFSIRSKRNGDRNSFLNFFGIKSKFFTGNVLFCILLSVLLSGCHDRKPYSVENMINSKIKFDVGQLDKEGLAGGEDGKYSITYEFCIPDTKTYRGKVKKIDNTVVFTNSPGRSMCGKNQILCMGNTHQPNAVKVLNKLSALSFVEKINETFFE